VKILLRYQCATNHLNIQFQYDFKLTKSLIWYKKNCHAPPIFNLPCAPCHPTTVSCNYWLLFQTVAWPSDTECMDSSHGC